MSAITPTVAIIDDDALVRDSVALALATHGWVTHTYPTGGDFLAAVQEGLLVHCLVLDLDLPDMSGTEVRRELVRLQVEIPTVILTADPHGPIAQAARSVGVATVLGKPASFDVLTRAVNRTGRWHKQARLRRPPWALCSYPANRR